MNLTEINVLVHHAHSDEPFMSFGTNDDGGMFKHWKDGCSAEDIDAHLSLLAWHLIVPTGLKDDGRFTLTDRGEVYVEALRALPLPVQKWDMP